MPESTHLTPWEPLGSMLDWWDVVSRASDIWWRRRGGKAAIDAVAHERFAKLVQFARTHSAFYRDRYRHLPEPDIVAGHLPVVGKHELMARFDDWVTDPAITRAGVEAFLADRTHIGERHLGRYVVWKSSGSTGVPGIFVQDADALATFDALIAAQFDAIGLAARFAWGFAAQPGRAALIAATDDHYASIASWQRIFRARPWLEARSFSMLAPLPRLVDALNAYRPAFVAAYPTILALLADEQAAGRLRIRPVVLWSGGETLAPATRVAIERAFGSRLVNEYGASECMSIAFECRAGWLHVNADWVILEPVDRDHRPTPPGTASHTVLLTNLANHVQPLIRYDLGDSVTISAAPCACGSPLPAIRVEGRRDDVVSLVAADGRVVQVLPLALTTVVEECAGIHRFQIIQSAPDQLTLRLDASDRNRRHLAWKAASGALRGYLARQSLPNVRVLLDEGPPVADPPAGKLRQVIAAREGEITPPVVGRKNAHASPSGGRGAHSI